MQAQHRLGLLARREQRIPVAGVDGRQPELVGRFRERHRAEAARGVAPDLVGRDLRVAEVRDLVRDEAPGRRAAPGVEVPVVVRAHRDEREVVVGGPHREALADEAREERREAQRRRDTVDVHVVDALVHVPRAAAHLVEAGRLEAVLRRRPSDDRVEPDVRQHLSLPHPRFAAVVGRHDARFVVRVLLGEAPGERVGRLDDVIVDGDDVVRALARLGLRQPGDRLAPALAAAEVLVAREVVERETGHVSTSGSLRSNWRTAPSQ